MANEKSLTQVLVAGGGVVKMIWQPLTLDFRQVGIYSNEGGSGTGLVEEVNIVLKMTSVSVSV